MRYLATLAAIALLLVFFLFARAFNRPFGSPPPTAVAVAFAENPIGVDGTADPFIAQITSSSTQSSYAGDISGDGRFVVIESAGDIATENPDNLDFNREIFVYDHAQRRIFQITHTKSAQRAVTACPTPTPTPTPSPSPSPSPDASPSPSPTPTPTPIPTPFPSCDTDVEVTNNKPVISHDGRFLVFTSNALNPGSFDGSDSANHAALSADGNQEVWLYQLPSVGNVDLSSGTETALNDLARGTFTRITDTPASRLPQPGTTTISPFVAFDNRDVAVNDDASLIAFTSSRNLASASGAGNSDGNPEIFIYQRTTQGFIQLTNTQGSLIFCGNPSLSGDGTVVAFISNANITESASGTGNNPDGNAEIFVTNFSGTTATNVRQVTRTTAATNGVSVNILSPGRRLSRNGNLLAFESTAELDSDNSIQSTLAVFAYNLGSNTFTQFGPRATSGSDVLRFPTFTGDSSTIVFASALNFNADGSAPDESTDGLNPDLTVQVFSAPVNNANSFIRLTNTPVSGSGLVAGIQPFVSETTERISFSLGGTELGGGNSDFSTEAFYLLVPETISEVPASDNAVAYQTGASLRDVVVSPSPSPTPTPPAVGGFAPGMLAIAHSSVQLAPSERSAGSASTARRPALPVELNGVSVSINGAAAGLYYVSPAQINFVVPPGLAANSSDQTYPVVINNNGAVIRSEIQIFSTQPDIFTDANGPNGRAAVFNVTNPFALLPEPFTITSTDETGETQSTRLRILITGVPNIATSQVVVRINETDISGDSILFVGPTETPGFYQIDFQLPESLAGAGDVPIIVTVTTDQAFSSRASDTGAPRIQIN